jgi:hypothetical protein
MQMAETQVAKIMRLLNISEEEALQVIADDKAIDKGEKLFEQTKEQKAVTKQMTATGTRKTPTVYNFDTTKRERKKDGTKEEFIANLAEYLQTSVENVQILNPSKLISFTIGEDTFELDLKRKRATKK